MVKIFLFDRKQGLKTNEYNFLYSKLDDDRKRKVDKYRLKKDSENSVIASSMIRALVIQNLKIQNKDIIFYKNRYGKLFLNGANSFEFNISHSKDYVVCSVGKKANGIDIEKIGDVNFKLAKRFFNKKEYETLIKSDDYEKLFFKLWTLKESYIKCLGIGLSYGLDKFGFEIYNDKIFKLDIHNNRYNLEVFDILNEYVMSVCSYDETIDKKLTFLTFKDIKNIFIGG